MQRKPKLFDDYIAYATCARVLDSTGYPIKATDVKLPKNEREARRSKYGDQW